MNTLDDLTLGQRPTGDRVLLAQWLLDYHNGSPYLVKNGNLMIRPERSGFLKNLYRRDAFDKRTYHGVADHLAVRPRPTTV